MFPSYCKSRLVLICLQPRQRTARVSVNVQQQGMILRKLKICGQRLRIISCWGDVVQNWEPLDKERACCSRNTVLRRDSRVSWRRNKSGVRSGAQGSVSGADSVTHRLCALGSCEQRGQKAAEWEKNG